MFDIIKNISQKSLNDFFLGGGALCIILDLDLVN